MRTPAERAGIGAWCILLFIATMWLHTRHNDFPWYYHTDEPGKVEQVLGMRDWNFHHPMLLLSTTKMAVGMSSAKATPQAVVEKGRTVSACFTAGAVVALSMLVFLWRGWIVGVVAGLALMLHHQLFELSHYMKEDPALLFGMAVTFLASFAYARAPSGILAAAIGAACGLAISGKYLGVISLVVAAVALMAVRRKGAWLSALVALVVMFVLVNLPLLSDWGTFSESFSRETKLVVEGQGSVTQQVPHSRYWSIFLSNSTPVAWVLLLAVLIVAIRRRKEIRAMEWTVLAFPFAFAIALSFSPKDNDRYFLPATAIFTVLAVIGISDIAEILRARFRPQKTEIVLGLALILSLFPDWTDDRAGLVRYYRAFQHDDTADLVRWLREHVPATSAIAKDAKVRLPAPLRHGDGPGASLLPNTILSGKYVADLGTFDELRLKSVAHIITTPSTYQTFDRAGLRPKEGHEDAFSRRYLFYRALRSNFDSPVWERPRGTVIYLHPGIEVYRIIE